MKTKEKPQLYFGIFKLYRKGFDIPKIVISSSVSNIDICEMVAVFTEPFKTRKEAEKKIKELPKPAMYVIMQVYLLL